MYRYEKSGELVIDGFQTGIAVSPHKGIANMQAVNISTETGEVMLSYSRIQQSQTNTTATGTLTASVGAGSFYLSATVGGFTLTAGVWISVSGSGITSLPDAVYYVVGKTLALCNLLQPISEAQ